MECRGAGCGGAGSTSDKTVLGEANIITPLLWLTALAGMKNVPANENQYQ